MRRFQTQPAPAGQRRNFAVQPGDKALNQRPLFRQSVFQRLRGGIRRLTILVFLMIGQRIVQQKSQVVLPVASGFAKICGNRTAVGGKGLNSPPTGQPVDKRTFQNFVKSLFFAANQAFFPIGAFDQPAGHVTQVKHPHIGIFRFHPVFENAQRIHLRKIVLPVDTGQQIVGQALFLILQNVISHRNFLEMLHRVFRLIVVGVPFFGAVAVAQLDRPRVGVGRNFQNLIVFQRVTIVHFFHPVKFFLQFRLHPRPPPKSDNG